MTSFWLVRHGKQAASWESASDPEISPQGRKQAENAALHLHQILPQNALIFSSPMRRCRQTAEPLLRKRKSELLIAPEATEIPSPVLPSQSPFPHRSAWLKKIFQTTWQDFLADPNLATSTDFARWRTELLDFLAERKQECVIFTHFVAINAACGKATGNPRILCRRPDHTSIWRFRQQDGTLILLEEGKQIETQIL